MSWYRNTQQTFAKLKERRSPVLGTGRPSQPAPTTICRYAYGFYRHAAMLAGIQLDVFTPLAEEPMTAARLGERLDIRPDRLKRLLDALVIGELLTRNGDRYANTAEADACLVRGRPGYLGGAGAIWSDLWQAALQTADSLRSGQPRARHDVGTTTDAELDLFIRALHPQAPDTGHALVDALGLANRRRLLEVGGGTAGLSIAACEACRDLHATVVAPPGRAGRITGLVAESGLGARIRVIEADLVAQPVEGRHDVAILRDALQGLAPEEARRVVQHVVERLTPGGAIHVLGWMLNDDELRPPNAVLHNLLYLNLFEDGAAHPASSVFEWLEEAGVAEVLRTDAPAAAGGPGFAMLSGRRPHGA